MKCLYLFPSFVLAMCGLSATAVLKGKDSFSNDVGFVCNKILHSIYGTLLCISDYFIDFWSFQLEYFGKVEVKSTPLVWFMNVSYCSGKYFKIFRNTARVKKSPCENLKIILI